MYKEKEEYLNYIIETAKQYKYIYIYGAGRFAGQYYNALSSKGININAFVVTSKEENREEYMGIPVIGIPEVKGSNDRTMFIIGTNELYYKEISSIVEAHGYKNIALRGKNDWFITEIENQRRNVAAIEVTTRIGCSVDCRFCPQKLLTNRYFAEDRKRKAELSLDDYRKCLEHLPNDAIITFSGFSEPFLNPECADMMVLTAQMRHKISLHTTLVGATRQDFDKIKDVPFEYLVIHLPDKEGYAHIPVTEEYKYVLDKVLDARKTNGEPWNISSNSQGEPLDEIIEIINHRMPYSNIHLLDRAGNLENEISEHVYHKGAIFCPKSPRLQRNILLPDGSLALCCMDFGLDHIIGNLIEKNYEDIRKDKALRMIKSAMDSDEEEVICRRCSIAKRNI